MSTFFNEPKKFIIIIINLVMMIIIIIITISKFRSVQKIFLFQRLFIYFSSRVLFFYNSKVFSLHFMALLSLNDAIQRKNDSQQFDKKQLLIKNWRLSSLNSYARTSTTQYSNFKWQLVVTKPIITIFWFLFSGKA